jgi:hypothetical protein
MNKITIDSKLLTKIEEWMYKCRKYLNSFNDLYLHSIKNTIYDMSFDYVFIYDSLILFNIPWVSISELLRYQPWNRSVMRLYYYIKDAQKLDSDCSFQDAKLLIKKHFI